jgi:hypothetical protein
MNRLSGALFGMVIAAFCNVATAAGDEVQAPAAQPRQLIYCADLMTPAEREAYRASMRAARSPEQRAALREAHRQDMRARARERGMDALECEPLRQRQRLRGVAP